MLTYLSQPRAEQQTVCVDALCCDDVAKVSERLGINMEISQQSQITINPYFLAQGSLWGRPGWLDFGFDDLPTSG